MAREKRQSESDSAKGAPEWMVTFSDCMTLLLTFFVMLLSFSSFDEKVFHLYLSVLSGGLPGVDSKTKMSGDSFLPPQEVMYLSEPDKGSEKPTLESQTDNNLKEETENINFRKCRVFLFPSDSIFWSRGSVISSEGQSALSDMAEFLKKMPGRIVISENGVTRDEYSQKVGLLRAWAVLDYFMTSHGLDKKWFSISAGSTLSQESFEGAQLNGLGNADNRRLEIVLLDRSIYN